MFIKGRHVRGHRRGASLIIAGMAMITVGAVAAVAIDLGMLYKARSDALRAAESAALAGASAFVDYAAIDPSALDSADGRARRFAESNTILNQPITAGEVQDVQIVPDSQKVRVVVRRQQVGTWFAKLLGVSSVPIGARAAAVAVAAGAGNCVRPLAIPDMWIESTEDPNGNRLEDDGENWSYTGDDPQYAPGDPNVPAGGTGYGSNTRDNYGGGQYKSDLGRPVTARLPDPTNPTPSLGPRQFLPFAPTQDPTDATAYRRGLEGCDGNKVDLGTPYPLMSPIPQVPANTAEVLDSLINDDNLAQWDDQTGSVRGSRFADWRNSSRVVKVGLFNPQQLGPGQTQVTLNNLGMMFLENYDQATNTLTGRFFYFATGVDDPNGANLGTLTKRLRLVE